MRRALALVTAVVFVACDPPPVLPSADERQNSDTARIEGEVVITGAARGNVVLTLFHADRPPPPEGTGRPLAFAFIPAEKVFGGAMDDAEDKGPFTAPYAFTLVPEGRYLIKGFIDRIACLPNLGCREPDFIPWYGVTGEPNAGDVGGAAVDPFTRTMRVIEVKRRDGRLVPTTDVNVSFSDSATLPADRPAFRVSGEAVIDPSKPAHLLQLDPEPISDGVMQLTAPTFLIRYVDDDQDGVPDDRNADGVPDFWPRVVVRKLADREPPLLDENDLDRDGVLDAEGPDYERADGTADGAPDLVVLAAGLRPDPLLAALTNEDGTPRMTPVPMEKLELIVRPLALDARDPAAPAPLKSLPKGRYAIVLIQFTGQTWRVPNELQPALAEAAGLPSVETQAFTLEVK